MRAASFAGSTEAGLFPLVAKGRVIDWARMRERHGSPIHRQARPVESNRLAFDMSALPIRGNAVEYLATEEKTMRTVETCMPYTVQEGRELLWRISVG